LDMFVYRPQDSLPHRLFRVAWQTSTCCIWKTHITIVRLVIIVFAVVRTRKFAGSPESEVNARLEMASKQNVVGAGCVDPVQ
jgi:hypothetical protein